MKPNWPTKKLGEISEISSGGTPSRANPTYFGGGIPFVKIGDMLNDPITETEETLTKEGLEKSAAKLWKKGTILFSIFATLGRVSELSIDAAANQAIAGIFNINKGLVEQKFLKYLLHKIGPVLALRGRGVAQNNINLSVLKKLEIPLPSPAIQQKIVERLDAVRKAQELNEKQISLTDELFQSLLHRELDPKGKNWEIKKVGEVVEKVTDGTHNIPPLVSSGIPLLDSTFINDFEIDIAKANKFISRKIDQELSSRCKPKDGDILISSRGSIGKLALVKKNQDFNIMANIALIRPGGGFISKFVLYFLFSHDAKCQLGLTAYGTSQKALYIKDIKNLKIPFPSIEIQRRIVEKLSAVQEYKKKLLQQKELLQELFESTLDKAMKGELVK